MTVSLESIAYGDQNYLAKLENNRAMLHVFTKRYPNLKSEFLGAGEIELRMPFDGGPDQAEPPAEPAA